MANIMDLLGDYKQTIAVNNNISKLYVLYQAMMMIGTVLSPGTIFLMVVGAVNIVLGYTTDVSIVLNLIPVLLFSIVCIVIKNNDHIIFMAMLLSIVYSMVMLAVYVGISIDMFHKTVFTPNSMFFMGLMGSFIVAAILHPQEFGCIIAMPLYMLLIPSMYLLLTIYSVTNMHVVTWGTREVKSKLTATVSTDDTQQSDSDITVANKPMANKSLLGYLNLSQLVGRGSDGRSGFGIITCMCCSPSQRPDDDNDNNRLLKQTLTEITGQLAKVTETVASIKSWTLDHQFMGQSSSDNHQVVVVVEEDTTGAGVGGNGQEVVVGGGQLTTTTTTTNCKQLLLNRLLNDVEGAGVGDGQSTIAADNNHHTTMVTIQDTGAVGSDGSVGHTPSSLSTIAESKQQLPQWIVDDRILKHLPIVPLNDDELDFWQTFIPKYLLPLDDDPVERDRMARDLLLLRNKWVFTFGLLNTIFILVVLLLQTHPEIFNFDIKLTNDDDDDDGYNITGYNNNNNKTAADNNKPMYSYMKMDPIGLVLVVFFGIILVIQLIGMFIHRFGTLSHLLAFTTIDLCHKKLNQTPTSKDMDANDDYDDDEEGIGNKNLIIKLTKQLQKLKGLADDDEEVVGMDDHQMGRLMSGSDTMSNTGGKHQIPVQHNLDHAFRKRLMSLQPDSSSSSTDIRQKSIVRRHSHVLQALCRRRDTIIMDNQRRMSRLSSTQLLSTVVEESSTIGSSSQR